MEKKQLKDIFNKVEDIMLRSTDEYEEVQFNETLKEFLLWEKEKNGSITEGTDYEEFKNDENVKKLLNEKENLSNELKNISRKFKTKCNVIKIYNGMMIHLFS